MGSKRLECIGGQERALKKNFLEFVSPIKPDRNDGGSQLVNMDRPERLGMTQLGKLARAKFGGKLRQGAPLPYLVGSINGVVGDNS